MKSQEIDPTIPENAVSVYGTTDAMDDFPVLKAFQQYIDAEQAKARKRLLTLGAFFGVLMLVVVAVFVGLLVNVSARNQALNDRFVEFVMRDRERSQMLPSVIGQDSSAVIALTTKINELQARLEDSQAKTEQMVAEAGAKAKQAAIDAAKSKEPSPEELEIKRLKALLAVEKEKHSAEREKRRQEELEAYRRKHYPEFYEKKKPKAEKKITQEEHDDLLEEVDRILEETEDADSLGAIRYYDHDDDESDAKTAMPPPPSTVAKPQKDYSIPVDIRGSNSRWNIPNE